MTDLVDIPLYFLGKRDYVNGLTLMEEMLKAYLHSKGQSFGWVTAIDLFRIDHFVRHKCRLEIHQKASPDRARILRASVRMRIITADSQSVYLLLFQMTNRPVRQRRPDYDRGQYIQRIDTDTLETTEATLYNIADLHTLMRGVIEVNHRFCCEQALQHDVGKGVSWAYLNGFRCPNVDRYALPMQVRFINTSIIPSRNRIFIIRRVELYDEDERNASKAEMGFFFDLPQVK